MDYNCNICKKSYKTKQSLWNHNNKYHNIEANVNKPINEKEKPNYICKYCNKELADRFSKCRHQKICLVKKTEIIELENKMNKMQDEINQLKKITKPINQTINTNNGTINNINYNIVQIGEENFNDILTDPQKILVLENYNPSNKLVELVYTNEDFKKYRNVRIPNLSNNKCQVYSKKDKRFRTKMKDSIMEKYGWNRRCDIEEMLHYIKEKNIKLKNTKEIEKLIDTKYNDDKYIKKNDEDILNTLYDYCYKLDEIYNYLNKQIAK